MLRSWLVSILLIPVDGTVLVPLSLTQFNLVLSHPDIKSLPSAMNVHATPADSVTVVYPRPAHPWDVCGVSGIYELSADDKDTLSVSVRRSLDELCAV